MPKKKKKKKKNSSSNRVNRDIIIIYVPNDKVFVSTSPSFVGLHYFFGVCVCTGNNNVIKRR